MITANTALKYLISCLEERERGDEGDKEGEEVEEGRGPEPNGFHGPEYRLQLY